MKRKNIQIWYIDFPVYLYIYVYTPPSASLSLSLVRSIEEGNT